MQKLYGEGLNDHLSWQITSKTKSGGSEWEIEEVVEEIQASTGAPRNSLSLLAAAAVDGDEIYVAVGKNSSSMEALSWALKHVAKPSSIVYLIHVFPEVLSIPTPLGMLPKSNVNPQQVDAFMNQERNKRRELLQKFLNLCMASKIQADTLLIESDLIEKAIVDLIPVLHIKRLIIGTTKSNLRNGKLRKKRSKAEVIYNNAPQYCAVKIICQGKEVKAADQTQSSSSPSNNSSSIQGNGNGRKNRNVMSCTWFPRKFM
ncbi:U-box domain-containing protein 35 [Dendrobium catenatum]|uniref:U-box domain-containing protein 35 n=1 Tax=Dendrobium catenatum TaxID=906689 RepID=UPI0009F6708A|nr:U-box domain-containing protein 35 [Dendrobium catenatum]